MDYIKNKVAPKREDRLNASIAYGGTACDLLQCSKEGCLLRKNRSFTQSSSCQFTLALGMVMTMPDTVIIMHGPLGCGSQSHGMEHSVRNGKKLRGQKERSLIWLTTNLDEADVIGGGEEKLEETILEADRRYKPSVIFIAVGCAPSIIGDDVDEVARRAEGEIGAKVIPLHCEGFKTKVVASAYDVVYHGLARHLDYEDSQLEDENHHLEVRQRKPRRVNLFNVGSVGYVDEAELLRLLTGIGLDVRVYPNYAHPDSFLEIGEAVLNISLCNVHDDYFLEFLKDKFGTPYLLFNMPLGIKNTSDWLIQIGKSLNIETAVREFVDFEERLIQEAIVPLREKLQGKTALLGGGVIRIAFNADLLRELGMEVLGVRAYHFDKLSEPIYERFSKDYPETQVSVASTQSFELVNILKQLKPDIYIGHAGTNAWGTKSGTVSTPLFSLPLNFLGYKGVFEIGRRLVKALENKNFTKNIADNAPLPYRESWYQKSPFAYIKD